MIDNKKILLSIFILLAAYLTDYFFLHMSEVNTVLDTKGGKLKGKISLSRDGREFYEFLGVPYAEPPTGKMRFLSPKPIKPWPGVKDATKYRPKCMQVDMLTNIKGGDENCLFLNVAAPKSVGVPSLLPVFVYFHGGHFMNGDPKNFGFKYWMDEDVVVVTVAYRLASLGFLNAGNKYARGNMGLKDQVQALKWVQENIQYFSGDPKRVFLLGHSAGGASAHLHMYSKMSKGLFHGVVSFSGTALGPFALQKNPIEQAKRLGKKLRCPSNRKTEAMVACLGQAEVQRLVESHREAVNFLHDPIAMFGPTIETVDDNEAFITKDPETMIKNGEIVNRVPWIVGVTSGEGLANAATVLRNSSMTSEINSKWDESLTRFLRLPSSSSKAPSKLRDFYFPENSEESSSPLSKETKEKFSNLIGDRMHVVPTHNSVLTAGGKSSPVYMYHFTQPSTLSLADIIYNQNGIFPPVVEIGVYLGVNWVKRLFSSNSNQGLQEKVAHFDDQTFLFNVPFFPEVNQGNEDYEFSKDLIKLWVSFARDGKPSTFKGIVWNPIESKKDGEKTSSPVLKFLEISKSPKIVVSPFENRVKFWNSLNLR